MRNGVLFSRSSDEEAYAIFLRDIIIIIIELIDNCFVLINLSFYLFLFFQTHILVFVYIFRGNILRMFHREYRK